MADPVSFLPTGIPTLDALLNPLLSSSHVAAISTFCAQHAPSWLSEYYTQATSDAGDLMEVVSQRAQQANVQVPSVSNDMGFPQNMNTISELCQGYAPPECAPLFEGVTVPETAKLVVGVLVLLVGMYVLNALLNTCTLNNFTTDRYGWSKEIVLITGGSSGIGELTVRKFLARGVKVVALDINPPKTPFQDLKNGTKKSAWFYQCDITSPGAVRATASQIYTDVGHPTILINNAGIARLKTILDLSPADVQSTLAVNTISHFWTVQTFLPDMIRNNHGHIVTLASMASFVTIAGNVDYSCSKAAALTFHEGLVQELKHRYNAPKIRASIIHPFWARTPLTDGLRKRNGFGATRTLDPECIADAVVQRVMSGRSGSVVLPGYMRVARGMRGWPVWMQEMTRGGQASSMVH